MNIFSTLAGKGLALLVLLVVLGGAFYFTEYKESPTSTLTPTPTPTSTTTVSTGPGGILPYHSGIRGTVMMGPTCPVERVPPDPACADRPLATTVTVFHKGDLVHPYAKTTSSATGAFEFSIPPGEYVVGAGGASMLPRCNNAPATVAAQGYSSVAVECDTGIR